MKSRITLRSLAFALATLPLSAGLSEAIAKPTVEVAFVLDTTGSMGGLIEAPSAKSGRLRRRSSILSLIHI